MASECSFDDDDLPQIELLIVAAGKDIGVFPLSLQSCLTMSQNNIIRVTVITPKCDVKLFEGTIDEMRLPVACRVIDEDEVIHLKERNIIKEKFPARYGWILQQFLAVFYISQSKSSAVLLMDSDTVLTRKVRWLDGKGNQILMASPYIHREYYRLIETIFGRRVDPEYSFVAHHMLIQPHLLRAILGFSENRTVANFLEEVLEEASPSDNSPMSVDFEPYGQFLWQDYRDRVRLVSLSNKGLRRSTKNISRVEKVLARKKKGGYPYKSVSLHSYTARAR